MATTEKWAKLFKSRHQYMDSIPIQFGDAKDVAITWDGTNLTVKPVTDDTGAFIIGDGTTDMDFKVFMNTSSKYVLFDQSGSIVTFVATALTLGADTAGTDLKLFGATTGNYLLWDASEDDLTLVGTATQLAVAGTTAADSATTGSIHTAGGIGIAGALWVGTTSRLVGAVTSSAGISNTGDVASSVTMTTPALRSASTGNVALIVNASGTGTIGIGSTSTGVVTITPATTVTGLLTTTGGITNNSAGIAAAGAISGATTIAASTSVTVTSASAVALAVGRLGATTPALVVDASTATSITGVSIKSAAASGGVAIAAVGETNVALTINAAGSGTIGIGSVSTGTVTITPAASFGSSITATGAVLPAVSGTPALGSATLMWSDLFLKSGAVINFNNGAVTLTHSTGVLTIAGARVVVSSTGDYISPAFSVTRTFVTSDFDQTYHAAARINLDLTNDVPADKYASAFNIRIIGAGDVASTGQLYGLWVDSAGTAAAIGGTFHMARFSVQAGAAIPTSYLQFQTADPGVAYAFAFVNNAAIPPCTAGGSDCTASGATDPTYTIAVQTPDGNPGYIRVWAAK